MDFSESQTSNLSELDQIIAALDEPGITELPVEAIRAAQSRREEITPRLIELIREAMEKVRAGNELEGNGPLFALFLLVEFRAKEARSTVVEAILLPDGGLYELFGDSIAEGDLSRVLAVLADDAPDTVYQLMSNTHLDELVRGEAASALQYWVRDGILSREEAVDRLRRCLKQVCEEEDVEFATPLVLELMCYAPHEARDEIKEAFERELVETFFVNQDDVERSIAAGEAEFQRELEKCGPTGFGDTVEEMSWWGDGEYDGEIDEEFDDESESELESDDADEDWDAEISTIERILPIDKVAPPSLLDAGTTIRNAEVRTGRNELCPCGSGKKYKKCCGGR